MIKTLILFVSIFLFATFKTFSQCQVTLTVISKIPDDQKIFVAGNKPELGNWNPGKVPLNKINDSTWSIAFKFSNNEIIEFKFTKGSWEEEALNEDAQVSGNKIINVLNDTTTVFKILDWGKSSPNVIGQITGNVKFHRGFKSRYVLPRDIIVWLPPSYNLHPDSYYPVLYMQDGQNLFDPSTSSFGRDWQMDETADSLIRVYAMQEIIIVGIYNSISRGKEYNNSNLGELYIQFLVEELKPFIDAIYHTLPDKKNTAIAGSSSGGLISFIALWNYPDIFSKAACVSPAFKISDIDFVAPVRTYSGARKNIKIYIDNGGIGLEEKLQPGIDEMITALKEKGYEEKHDFIFVKDQYAEHTEFAWSRRVYKFLEYLFPPVENN